MALSVNRISFTGNDKDDKRVTATEVGVGAGATVGGAKYGAEAFKRFKRARTKDVVHLSGETTQAIRNAAKLGTETKTLWGRMLKNARVYKEAIINWAQSLKIAKWAKPIVESKAFARFSGILGGITAGFVFISGIGEMGQTFGKLAAKDA